MKQLKQTKQMKQMKQMKEAVSEWSSSMLGVLKTSPKAVRVLYRPFSARKSLVLALDRSKI
jgi:hypothetical protein